MKPTINLGKAYVYHDGSVVAYPTGNEIPTATFLTDLAAAIRTRDSLNSAIENMEAVLAAEFEGP